jgi:GDP-mannose 6-dehydrogenase
MNISIFGLGYVGCVSLGCLAQSGHTVIGVDISETKVKQINSGLPTIIEKDIDIIIHEEHEKGRISATTDFQKAILNTELSIIAVGTPSSNNGHLDLTYIFKVAEQFGEALKNKNEFHVISIRSTVMPGTTDKFAQIIEQKSGKKKNIDFAVVCNPEFLREGSAVHDYFNPPLTLIGTDCQEAKEKIESIYSSLPAKIVATDIKIAEVMKYINNTFHALKIAFANEVGNICASLDIDSYKVMDIFCMDQQLNISPYYFKPGFAYGGSCLPKDLKGLQTLAHDLYVKVPVIESIDKTNDLQIKRAIDLIQQTGKKNIVFLGLSFKAGTDDLRNSPAVTVVETLLGKGYNIKIYDRNIHLSRLTGTNKEYIDHHIPHLYKLISSEIKGLIDDADVVVVNNKEREYTDMLLETESQALIIDLVRLPEAIRTRTNYMGINW